MIQLLEPNPVKTKPADDPKSSGYPADLNPLVDALSTDTFTFHRKKTNSTKKKNTVVRSVNSGLQACRHLDPDGRHTVNAIIIATLSTDISHKQSANKAFQNSCPLKQLTPGLFTISVTISSKVHERSLPLTSSSHPFQGPITIKNLQNYIS